MLSGNGSYSGSGFDIKCYDKTQKSQELKIKMRTFLQTMLLLKLQRKIWYKILIWKTVLNMVWIRSWSFPKSEPKMVSVPQHWFLPWMTIQKDGTVQTSIMREYGTYFVNILRAILCGKFFYANKLRTGNWVNLKIYRRSEKPFTFV